MNIGYLQIAQVPRRVTTRVQFQQRHLSIPKSCPLNGPYLPLTTFLHRAGIRVDRLLPEHTETVKHYWPFAADVLEAHPIIDDGVLAGLSAGAFVTEPASQSSGDLGDQEEPLPADGLASWAVVNHNGGLGFLHTLSSQRRQGLAGLVLAELTRISEAAGYPPVFHTNHPAVRRVAQELGYVELFPITWAGVTPTASEATHGA